MNREIAERWVAALRSGDYRQDTGGLRSKNGFCCLGVLCDVAMADGIVEQWQHDQMGAFYFRENGGCQGALLSDGVRRWARMCSDSGIVPGYADDLVALNDIRRWTFDQIADFIEKNAEKM